MMLALLDTDILNEVLKQRNALVQSKTTAYLAQHGQFCISAITRFELVPPGYLESNATTQLADLPYFVRIRSYCR